jgi:hypothetical protein
VGAPASGCGVHWIVGKSGGKQRTQYSVLNFPSVAVTTTAPFSATSTGCDRDAPAGRISEVDVPGGAVAETVNVLVWAAHCTE